MALRVLAGASSRHLLSAAPRCAASGAGYEYLHIAIDDHSRISFAAILPDQNHQSAMLFFFMARAFYSRFGFAIKRVLTDNGPCYRDGNFQTLLLQQRIKHRSTRPYNPRTNGKAECFIKTALCERAYARTYQTSLERHDQLGPWLHNYNFHRQHASLARRSQSEQRLESPQLGWYVGLYPLSKKRSRNVGGC